MRVICERDPELNRAHRVELEGRLDAVGAVAMWDGVSDRVTSEIPNLIIDMSRVRYMSSGGIGMLMRLLTRVTQAGGSLVVCGCSSKVRTVLSVVGMEGILNLREVDQDARERLRELGAD